MTALSIFLVSVIQGVTEFLPVSSSGHLILLPSLSGLADQGQTADVAAHLGTLAAVMLYLRGELMAMLSAFLPSAGEGRPARRLAGLLILASLPVIFTGLVVELLSPTVLRLALTVAAANVIFSLWLYWADRQPVRHNLHRADTRFDWSRLTIRQAGLIGLAQIFALIPGASRSGVTMTMARQLGLDRLSAARFSLLLSIPVISGAAVLKLAGLITADTPADVPALASIIVLSFVFALLAIRWMMGWLAKASFTIFIVYRLGLGVVLFALIGSGVIS
ncbi:MAG: undecaprenyl-diphosphate phosphatase [Pseudomonadota bacterium]|nr:undecaprenyl-diphosphate phosphatase [Pseudomonadota bacterium]